MKKIVLIFILLITPSIKASADELLSPHTMGHILGGIGSFSWSITRDWAVSASRIT